MENILLNFSFDNWKPAFLTFLPAVISFGICLYVFLFLNRDKANKSFYAFLFFAGLWQLGEGFARISVSSESALEWYRISGAPSIFMLVFGFLFVVQFVKLDKRIREPFLFPFIFLPAIIFELCIIARIDQYIIIKSHVWNWIISPQISIINRTIYFWMALTALTMLGLFWWNYFQNRSKENVRTQSLLLAIGFSIPSIGGIIAEVLFPLAFNMDSVPLSASLMTIFSIFSLIAIRNYKMLEYSPKHQWHQIVESMNEGILIVDNADRIKYANESFCRLLGYEFTEIKGEIANVLFMDEDQRMKMDDRSAKKRRRSGQYEMSLKRKDGSIVWMLISGAPYLDDGGEEVGTISVQTNITHLKEAEKMYEHNEARLKQAQEITHIGSWEVNFSTNQAIWSDEACKIFGLSPDEKNDQSFESWISFIHPDDMDKVKKEIEISRRNLSNFSYKYRIVRADGNIRHVHCVNRFEFNKEKVPTGLFGVCHDITDQIESEKIVLESEEKMRTFINESLLSICFIDPITKKLLYSNPSLSELLGYSSEELDQITIYDLVYHSSQDVDQKIEQVKQQKRISNGERQWKRKDGKTVYVLVSSFYQERKEGAVIYIAAQNITERKLAEEKLIETNLELKTFIYKASHDLRAPLASIIGLVNISKLEIKEPESLSYLNMIGTATQKLDYTLGELVKAMQIKEAVAFSDKIDFNKLIEDVLKKFGHFPGFSKLKISTHIEVNELFLSNKSIIETILQNLIENAIKYQKINEPQPFLKINIKINDQNIELKVEDNGIGIEESLQKFIFDMYFRANSEAKGSGLGLYLVRKGVEKLKGEIQLISKPGNGAIFTVLLPTELLLSKQ